MLEEEKSGRKPLREEPDTEKEGLDTPFNVRDFFFIIIILFCFLPACNRAHPSGPHATPIIPFIFCLVLVTTVRVV